MFTTLPVSSRPPRAIAFAWLLIPLLPWMGVPGSVLLADEFFGGQYLFESSAVESSNGSTTAAFESPIVPQELFFSNNGRPREDCHCENPLSVSSSNFVEGLPSVIRYHGGSGIHVNSFEPYDSVYHPAASTQPASSVPFISGAANRLLSSQPYRAAASGFGVIYNPSPFVPTETVFQHDVASNLTFSSVIVTSGNSFVALESNRHITQDVLHSESKNDDADADKAPSKVPRIPSAETKPEQKISKKEEPTRRPPKPAPRPGVSPVLVWNMPSHDSAQVGFTEITSHDRIRMDSGQGLDLTKGWAQFPVSSKKFLNAIRDAKAFMIVADVTCSDDRQKGPARILTCSKDTQHRNVTLGQESGTFVVRIRSDKEDQNGTKHETRFGRVFAGKRQQIIVRYDGLHLECYVNGKIAAKREFKTDFSSWERFPVIAGNEQTTDRKWSGTIHSMSVAPTANQTQLQTFLDQTSRPKQK